MIQRTVMRGTSIGIGHSANRFPACTAIQDRCHHGGQVVSLHHKPNPTVNPVSRYLIRGLPIESKLLHPRWSP